MNLKLVILSCLLITSCISRSANLIGIQVMEMDDLILLEASHDVGNLAYGDECRNNGISAITEDVCFHSNPLFQCLDGRCSCAYILLENGPRSEQLVFENGKCKRPLNFQCTSSQDCVNGLSCLPGTVKKSGPIDSQTNELEEDERIDERLTTANLYRKRITARIKMIAEKNSKHGNTSVSFGEKSTRKTTTTTLEPFPDDEIEAIASYNEQEEFSPNSLNQKPIVTDDKKSMLCLQASSRTIYQTLACLKVNLGLIIIHYTIHLFFVKI